MNASEQIAAINRKRADEHRRVDLVHDRMIEVVRERCVHEPLVPKSDFDAFFEEARKRETGVLAICKHCGANMAAR